MEYLINGSTLTAIADAIRDKTGTTKSMTPEQMVTEIEKTYSDFDEYIMFLGDEGDFTLEATNVEWDGVVEYSTDKSYWMTWDGSRISSSNKKLYMRGSGNTTFCTSNGMRLVLSALAGCYGNLNALLEYGYSIYELTTINSNCYAHMFDGCGGLTHAPALPATILSDNCYAYMFRNCESLAQAPNLPATTLASGCYEHMFDGCKYLTRVHKLRAKTLSDGCYTSMFANCPSLTQVPDLPATTLAKECCTYMFQNCESLTKAPALPATTLANHCYRYMFDGCISLTRAPALPATTLESYCYMYMFQGCTSLTKVPDLPATTLTASCYRNMFKDCIGIKLSVTQTGDYQTAYRIPTSGTGTTPASGGNSLKDMFTNTGGTFTGTPTINTTYYGAWGA